MRMLFLLMAIVPFVCYPQTSKWQLVWADEFEESGLPDAKKWGYDVGGHGWGNKELQYYTSGRKENARVENGHLIIEARREALEGREYTSARLVSKGKGDWTYGRFEVRAKLPTGRGTWPAIWMLPSQKDYGGWPEGGEIDIMEHVGFDPDVIHASTHTKSYHHSIGTQKTARLNVANARTAFNTYAVEWTPEEIRAFVNDQHYFTFKNERLTNPAADHKQWPFDKPFHFLLNIAVGGTWGGQKGVDKTIWPQRMEIDYVRVYQQSGPVQTRAEPGNDQKEAAKLERQERRQQLISYLDGIAQKAAEIDDIGDRVRVLTEVADAFWFLDHSRSLALFNQLFPTEDETEAETRSLRQSTLARIAKRDAHLAAKLVSNDPAPSPAERSSRELNAMGTPSADTLLAVAITLLKTDVQQSVSLARLALRDGMSQMTRNYLQQLRAIDPTLANSLLEQALQHAATRNPARLFDALALWEYAFQPGPFHFGPVSWPINAEKSYEVPESLKLAVLQFAVNALNQNIQLRLATGEANTTQSEAYMRVARLYSVIQQLLPHIAVYIPRAADPLRAELSVLEQAIRTSGQKLPTAMKFKSSPEETSRGIDNLLQKAERTVGGKERDELFLAAAYRLLFDGQFERAASIASRIDDMEMENGITDAINFNWVGSKLGSGDTAAALSLARSIRAQEPKIVALARIGAVLTTRGDSVVAEEVLHEAQTLASKATPSAVVSSAVLSVALTRATTQRDSAKAFETLSLAASIINKTNSELSWYRLNEKSDKGPLKVASLNGVPSLPGGGFKSVRVTYPRLAGLTEVFGEASRHDLHQAMRIAQDLSSKALSLAVQASVCRSSAERLAQEERK